MLNWKRIAGAIVEGMLRGVAKALLATVDGLLWTADRAATWGRP